MSKLRKLGFLGTLAASLFIGWKSPAAPRTIPAVSLEGVVQEELHAPAARERFPFIIQMNSGEEYFVSSAAFTIHDRDGTGRGWITPTTVFLNNNTYTVSDGLEQKFMSQEGAAGTIIANTQGRAPFDTTAPQFSVQNKEDLDGNSLLNNICLLMTIHSEPGLTFYVHDSQRLQEMCVARTLTTNFPLRLQGEGEHSILITAVDMAGNSSSEQINLSVGGYTFAVDNIQFRTCGRAYDQFSRNPELYKQLARFVNQMNVHLRNRERNIQQINIPQFSCYQYAYPPFHPVVLESGGTIDACHLDMIYIGQGNFTQCRDTMRRLRDVYTHEFGHHVLDSLPVQEQAAFERLFRELSQTAADVRNPLFFQLFHDGTYTERRDMGHSFDRAHELFASAYNISMNYWDEFQELLRTHDQKIQRYAMSVMDFVLQHQAH